MSEVVALFGSRAEAERAVDEISANDFFDVHNVGYMDRYRDESGEMITDPTYFDDYEADDYDNEVGDEASKGAAGGAVGGAAVGAGAALLGSAGLLLVPGIGPFLAAGTIAGTLGATAVGAAGGAVVGGATGAIFGAAEDNDHVEHEVSKHYREGVAQGDAMVTLEVERDEANAVAEAFRALGARRVDIYGDEGWLDH